MCTTVITHGYSAPILESAEHDFYLVPLLINLLVIDHRSFSAVSARNTRRDSFTGQGMTKTSRHHSLYPPEAPWPAAEYQAGQQRLCSRSPDRRTDGRPTVDRRHCRQRGVLNSGRLLCVRYIGKGPFFQQTCCCPVCLEMCGINHQACCGAVLFNKLRKNPVKDTQSAPADKTIVESFVWSIPRAGHLSIAGHA